MGQHFTISITPIFNLKQKQGLKSSKVSQSAVFFIKLQSFACDFKASANLKIAVFCTHKTDKFWTEKTSFDETILTYREQAGSELWIAWKLCARLPNGDSIKSSIIVKEDIGNECNCRALQHYSYSHFVFESKNQQNP